MSQCLDLQEGAGYTSAMLPTTEWRAGSSSSTSRPGLPHNHFHGNQKRLTSKAAVLDKLVLHGQLVDDSLPGKSNVEHSQPCLRADGDVA